MSAKYFKTVSFPINDNLTPNGFPFGSNPKYHRNYDYEWIFVFGGMMAFFAAYGIGANDVANSFAPSVGAKTLKLWQACVLAAICEFLGALLLGARVTDTIKGKVTSPSAFVGNDDLLMFGMICADLTVGTWLLLATKFEFPVSTTHSVVGAIVGFSLASPAGASAVDWQSIGMIVASWFVSPILAGVFSALIFVPVRHFILRHEDSFERALKFYPIILAFTISLNLSFILVKSGVSNGIVKGLDAGEAIGVSVAAGVGAGIIFYFTFIRYFRNKYMNYPIEDPSDTERKIFIANKQNGASTTVTSQNVEEGSVDKIEDNMKKQTSLASLAQGETKKSRFGQMETFAGKMVGGGDVNRVHRDIQTNETVTDIHEHAEIFPYRTECVFSLLQVLSACAGSFAHGSNDVANAIGPFSAVTAIYTTGSIEGAKKVPVPVWILCMGGAGIVLGLSTYGYKIMAAIGVKLAKVTPSRGFTMELGSSMIIIIGSFLGLPLSTTHCIVGSTVGIGLLEGRKGVNWKILGTTFLGWVFTLLVACGMCCAIFSFATFAPSQYYPLSANNCLAYYGQVYNQTKTGFGGPIQIPLQNGYVNVLGGYPTTGKTVNIFDSNPSSP